LICFFKKIFEKYPLKNIIKVSLKFVKRACAFGGDVVECFFVLGMFRWHKVANEHLSSIEGNRRKQK